MESQAAAATQPTAPEVYLTQLAFGALVTQALYVVAKLGVADLLADKSLLVSDLAKATGTDEGALYRVLRSLASVGVFKEGESKTFSLTPKAEPLRSDHPSSMRNALIFMGAEWHWRVWGNIMHSVQTGKPAWGRVLGQEVFDYFQANPEHYEIFNRAMTDMSGATAPAIVEAYDYSSIETLVDIAGGHGFLLSQILKSNPNLRGVLFDLPQVLEGAEPLLRREGVWARLECSAGDFFEAVPAGADAYMLKHIIHDWDDDRAIRILHNIRNAMKPNGRILIMESVIPESNEPHFGKLMDLEMLVSPGGIERTKTEYGELLKRAGLRLNRVIPTNSAYSIIEAVSDAQ